MLVYLITKQLAAEKKKHNQFNHSNSMNLPVKFAKKMNITYKFITTESEN